MCGDVGRGGQNDSLRVTLGIEAKRGEGGASERAIWKLALGHFSGAHMGRTEKKRYFAGFASVQSERKMEASRR